MRKYVVIRTHGRSEDEIQAQVNLYAGEYIVTHVCDAMIIMTYVGGKNGNER